MSANDIGDYRNVYGGQAPFDGYQLPRFSLQSNLEGGYPPNWFLGPRGENLGLFEELLLEAIQSNAVFRRSFHPEDGPAIRETVKADPEFLKGVDTLRHHFGELLASLRHDTTPYYSWRYQGHMLWDTTLPSMLGYFATMLHNPNNVTIQASTLTTFLEQLVGWDLCGMLGFPFPDLDKGTRQVDDPNDAVDDIVPHGHLTSGGTVANIESTWAARELRFLPVAIYGALTESDSPLYWYTAEQKASLTVTTAEGTESSIMELSRWELLNVRQDSALRIPTAIHRLGPPDLPGDRMQLRWRERDVWDLLLSGSINALGPAGFYAEFLSKAEMTPIGGPVILGPVTWHYSWPKAMALLGGGTAEPGVMAVQVDAAGRMDLTDLELQLNRALAARNPVLMVVSVMGSTEESAVDDLDAVLALRDRFRSRGLEFNVHVDAAWGGYFASVLRKDYEDPGKDNRHGTGDPLLAEEDLHLGSTTRGEQAAVSGPAPPSDADGSDRLPIEFPVFASKHVVRQLRAIRRADSATIDPHKTGYVPYPAGAITYRNGAVRRLVTFGAPVIGSDDTAVSVGEFGVEGSKPGATAAAVYLSHAVVRPSHSGHGRLMNASLVNTRVLYSCLLELNLREDDFVTIPMVDLRLRSGEAWARGTRGDLRASYARWLAGTNGTPGTEVNRLARAVEEVLVDGGQDRLPAEQYAWLRDVGPDLNIVDYMFNYRTTDGAVNTDLRLANLFNREIYRRLHVPQGEIVGGALVRDTETHDLPALVSKTDIWRNTYGDDFVFPFMERLGITQFGPERPISEILTATGDEREEGEMLLDCYRKITVMRSVVMDPFLHARSESGEFYGDEWARLVGRVVRAVAEEFRENPPGDDATCGS